MAVPVEVPNLGEEMAGGVVAEWYLADGAEVAAGDPVCRVECSFVAVEVEAGGAGLLRQSKPAGSIERPGALLGHILAKGEAIPQHQNQAAMSEPEPEPLPPPAEGGADDLRGDEPAHLEDAFVTGAVVVPFPRRFAPQREPAWEQAPGDAVEFASSLFEPADVLPEPGGSIPGLPLWEPEDERAGAAAYRAEPHERFARISADVESAAQILTMTVEVDSRECARMLVVCAREWHAAGINPMFEDLAVRAIAKAAAETAVPADSAGILIFDEASETSAAIKSPAARTLREAVEARLAGGDTPFESADVVVTSFARQGITSATPRLTADTLLAFALGAPGADGLCAFTMAYESTRLGEATAARLLARVRDILEAPYAMLV